ncbi:hypothetical protein [Blastococcus sp. SYSU DS0541]
MHRLAQIRPVAPGEWGAVRDIEHAAAQAVATGVPALILTTFEDVPWNAPHYRRCGFRVLDEREWTPGLRAIREREAAHGLDRWARVCMRRNLPARVSR